MLKTIMHGTGMTEASAKDYSHFSYFLGGIDVTSQNVDQFTPYIPGVSRIFLHKPCPFITMLSPEMTTFFKTYLETGYTSINGISDISVNFTDFEGGFAGQRLSNVSLAQDDTDEISITLYELQGSPLREYLDLWVTGVRDPRSGIAHYHGLVEEGKLVYKEGNHTAEMIYTTMDPTGLKNEYVCMFAHMFPTKVPKDHLNYEKGSRDGVSMDISFKCTKYESAAINEIGNWYITNSRIDYNYLDFDPLKGTKNPGTTYGTPYGSTEGEVYTYEYGSGKGAINGSVAGGKLS